MIRGYVAVVAGDSASVDIRPNFASCKKTAVKLVTADENRFEFYINIKGTDYSFKVVGNVRTMDKHNITSGLLRIGFIVPNLDIVVSGNPQELEAFLFTLVAIKDPRVLPPMCSDSTHEREFESLCSNLYFLKLMGSEISETAYLDEFCSFCCFRILKGYSLDDAHKIQNTWKSSIRVTASGMMSPLNSITVNSYPFLQKIDASDSMSFEIPDGLGSLPCLKTLDLSYNGLGRATNWNWLTSPFLRENLFDLRLTNNKLHTIPETISGLRNLQRLDLSFNYLTELPTALGSLKFLSRLNISDNKLEILPGWMYRKERFFELYASGNKFEFKSDIVAEPQLQSNEFQPVAVPSLFKTVARYIIANSLAFWEYNIPTTITDYLEAAYICRCDSLVSPDTTGPVVQCWIKGNAVAIIEDYGFSADCRFPIAICCCSYECYKRMSLEPTRLEQIFIDGKEYWL